MSGLIQSLSNAVHRHIKYKVYATKPFGVDEVAFKEVLTEWLCQVH